MSEGTNIAPDGQTWVCQACGKKSRTRYGFDASNKSVASAGWDESCVMNCSLFHDDQLVHNLHGRVIEIMARPTPTPSEGRDG